MKFISFVRNGKPGVGAVVGESVIDLGSRIGHSNLGSALRTLGLDALKDKAASASADFAINEIEAFRPVVADPGLIACAGLNYAAHVAETRREVTERPTIFLRVSESQLGHEQEMKIPPESAKLDYEGEIAVVIGKGGRRIAEGKAYEHIAGYSCYNDGSVRDWQLHTSQWIPGKNFQGTGAFGPWLVTTDEIRESDVLTLETRLNGEVMQHADTDLLLFPIATLISYVSTFVTLNPGDVIVTGTPGGVGAKRQPPVFMKAGDIVEVEVSKVGVLRNRVAAE